MLLLKMLNLREGKVMVDVQDLDTLRSEEVRSRLNVITQESYFSPDGDMRASIDPTGRADDSDIESSLRKVGLWDKASLRGGLDGELSESEWSSGERQLLSLTRALLVPSNILILDEAMSK